MREGQATVSEEHQEGGSVMTMEPISGGPQVAELTGKTVAVVGIGKSGVAAAHLLQAVGAHVRIVDEQHESAFSARLGQLDRTNLEIFAGTRASAGLEGADIVVVSPGVPTRLEMLELARSRGVSVIGEVELASWFLPMPIIAVTGTNGKSTVVSLIHRMFTESGRSVFLGGNIGTPLCEAALTTRQQTSSPEKAFGSFEAVIAEISSFQLETIDHFRPKVATLLNITPDHLDRYSSMDDYRAAKARIFENQTGEDFAILNRDDMEAARFRTSLASSVVEFSVKQALTEGVYFEGEHIVAKWKGQRHEMATRDEIPLRGSHNLTNVLAAVAVGLVCQCPPEAIRRAITTFSGIEHALEVVSERRGILYINDSKGTNIDATIKAMESFDRPLVMILGGKDKGGDFIRLREPVRQRAKLAIVMGESTPRIQDALQGIGPILHAASLGEAVTLAAQEAKAGDVVLLSPACASFDMFHDYQDRGRQFRELVLALPA